MTKFNLAAVRDASVWSMYRNRERIQLNPYYQREGDIWNIDKRQLLIDTIINGFDVPKIYLHKISQDNANSDHDFAVIDGKQRLSTMWDFIRGGFALASDFEYVRDESLKLGGMTYADLSGEHPEIVADFNAYHLDIVTIETSEIELIEDMFSRLNEAVPLNAAEKRNAKPGPLPQMVRDLSALPFFSKKIPFSNRRYRHFDISAKMLYLASRGGAADTKKAYLDRFFVENSKATRASIAQYEQKVTEVLLAMEKIFTDSDYLLRSVGMIILYFLLFDRAIMTGNVSLISRSTIIGFDDARRENRIMAESDIAKADYDLLEFDRLTQSPNDGVSLRFRLAVIDEHLFFGILGFDPPAPKQE
jgi:hypothetical protein